MKRRKAIGRIAMTLLGGGIVFSGYKWYDWNKAPDFPYLEKHRELISALAATIIPTTETPGAKEAGVGDFIISMIETCTERMTANKFIDGLKELENNCQSRFQKPYEQCKESEREAVLAHFENISKPFSGIIGKVQNRFLGKPFFTTLKDYTVEGYCTSEPGATKGLFYDPIPGSFHGCVPMHPGQRAWATR
jgi:hypothetical protein